MSKIFISHSSANNAAALGIAAWLKKTAGVTRPSGCRPADRCRQNNGDGYDVVGHGPSRSENFARYTFIPGDGRFRLHRAGPHGVSKDQPAGFGFCEQE
jgi:hypothetical protein